MTQNVLPDLPKDISDRLDALLPSVGETYRDGRVDESMSLLDDAWALIPEPKFGWNFYPQIMSMQMIKNATAKEDSSLLEDAIRTTHEAYLDPDSTDHYVLSEAGNAWRALGNTAKAKAAYTKIEEIYGKKHLRPEQLEFLEGS